MTEWTPWLAGVEAGFIGAVVAATTYVVVVLVRAARRIARNG